MSLSFQDTFYLLLFTKSNGNSTVPYLAEFSSLGARLQLTFYTTTCNFKYFCSNYSAVCSLTSWRMPTFWLKCRYMCKKNRREVVYKCMCFSYSINSFILPCNSGSYHLLSQFQCSQPIVELNLVRRSQYHAMIGRRLVTMSDSISASWQRNNTGFHRYSSSRVRFFDLAKSNLNTRTFVNYLSIVCAWNNCYPGRQVSIITQERFPDCPKTTAEFFRPSCTLHWTTSILVSR